MKFPGGQKYLGFHCDSKYKFDSYQKSYLPVLQKSKIQKTRVKPLCYQNSTMTLLRSWISVLMAFLLLLYFWRAKVYASGNPEEEIDFTYVTIGATLGALIAIAFVAIIICMIKKQMIDNVFGESDGKMDRRSNMGSSQNRDDVNILQKQSTGDQ
ncbi:transmembrane protein 273 [Apus apus]|uniref:transmembrane protein 273 n=1 Tax=Apus apus TaxID=8895 RepID=UPI0021F83030|nr:transmembrane protein 273 [Apus apus]